MNCLQIVLVTMGERPREQPIRHPGTKRCDLQANMRRGFGFISEPGYGGRAENGLGGVFARLTGSIRNGPTILILLTRFTEPRYVSTI